MSGAQAPTLAPAASDAGRAAGRVPADAGALTARPFATDPTDLAVRIDPLEPVASVDALLSSCLEGADGGRPAPAEVRSWTVARRLDALLAIRRAGGSAAESFSFRCPDGACGEAFEAEIDLGGSSRPEAGEAIEFEVGERRLRARAPTGTDQGRWQRERTPLSLVAASLLGSTDPASGAEIEALDQALARSDPMRELHLDLDCPACGRRAAHRVELEPHLLAAFARDQRIWLAEIGRLALAFHWAEDDLARLPRWRRAFYLARLDADGSGLSPP